MTAGPPVSVVIPVRDGDRFLAQAIESVLRQTHPAAEIIVVDDGSIDRSGQIADSFGPSVKRISVQPKGVSTARNVGVTESRSPLVAFLDSDDVWLEQKLETQVRLFSDRPHLGLVYSGVAVVDEAGRRIAARPAPAPEQALRNTLLLEQPSISLSQTALMPRKLFLELGGFDERLEVCEDIDLACRVAMVAPIGGVQDVHTLYRMHAAQRHRDPMRTERDTLRVLDKLFVDPRLPRYLIGQKRRAEANLYASIAGRHLQMRSWMRAVTYAARAGKVRPDRLAAAMARLADRDGADLTLT